jgi:hypothetical protein
VKQVFYDDEKIRKPSENLAINNFYFNQVRDNKFDIIARIYRHEKGIILGRNHDVDDVNISACEANNYEVARRITGGLAVIVDPSIICYSVFLSQKVTKNQDNKDIYKKIVVPLAQRLGSDFFVKGNFYIRQKVNGEFIPVAGHSMTSSDGVTQFDGIVHNYPLDVDFVSGLLKLRELRSYGSSKVISLENEKKIYDLKGKELNVPYEETSIIEKESDILKRIKGLSFSGVSEQDFVNKFYEVLTSEFGDFKKEKSFNLESLLDGKLFNELRVPGKFYKKARGHCFVDFADPEEPW